METNRTDVMIIDTDKSRIRSFRRMLRQSKSGLRIEDCSDTAKVHDAIISRRPTLVLLHSTFPYMAEDGTGLLEMIAEDFRVNRTGVFLVMPISGSLLYRSGFQEGLEMLSHANDIITTDLTQDMIQSMVSSYLERAAEREAVREEAIETATEAAEIKAPAYKLVSKRV